APRRACVPIVLFRVDERLIHGQVVVAWGEHLNVDRIIVIDDGLAESPWERELYCLGVPPSVHVAFVTVSEAKRDLPVWRADSRRVVVLVRDVETLERIAADGALDGDEINLGGIHSAPGRERLLPYLFLSRDERDSLRRVAGTGALISARDLPGSRSVSLGELLAADG